MSHIGFFVPNDWNAQCDCCGVDWKGSQLRLRWDNARVCAECWEPRNQQDFVRGKPDKQAPPWTRPAPAPVFVNPVGPKRLIDAYLIGQITLG